MKTLLLLMALISTSFAAVLEETPEGDYRITKPVVTAGEMLDAYVNLKKLNLSADRDFPYQKSFQVNGLTIIKSSQIDSYVTNLVAQSGMTMVRFPDSNLVKVLNARDIRYETIPVHKKVSAIPKDHSWSQMVYTLKYIEPSQLTRNLRPFLSRYGRIIDEKYSNVIYITEENANLRRLMDIIQFLDTEAYAKNMKETKQLNQKHEQVIGKEKGILEILSSNQIIFLILFFVLGSIIGFGIRGFMMKRIEGGW